MDNSSPILVGGACSALSLLARCAQLPLVDGKGDSEIDPGKMDVLLKLQSVMNSVKMTPKVRNNKVQKYVLCHLYSGHVLIPNIFFTLNSMYRSKSGLSKLLGISVSGRISLIARK